MVYALVIQNHIPPLTERTWTNLFCFHAGQSCEICNYHHDVRNEQSNDHDSDESCRKSSDQPKNINSWFKMREKLALTIDYPKS